MVHAIGIWDKPEEGGFIGRNPKDHTDMWYIAKQYAIDNFDLNNPE